MTTLWTHLDTQARFFESRPLFISDNEDSSFSYSTSWMNIRKVASWFHSKGISRVAILATNSVEYAEIFIAGLISGITVAVIPDTSLPREVVESVGFTGSQLVLTTKVGPELQEIRALGAGLPVVIESLSEAYSQARDSQERLTDNFAYGELIISTSGSESEPKGLVLGGAELWESAKIFSAVYDIKFGKRFWNYLPMSYLGGLLNLLLIPIAGSAAIYVDGAFSSTTFSKFLPTLERVNINSLWLVPTIARGLLRLITRDESSQASLSKLELVLVGTAPISSEELIKAEELLGCPVFQSYGLTETTFVSLSKVAATNGETSVGKVFPGVQVRIDPTSNHILVKSPHIFKAKVSDDDREMIDRSQWFDTGDLGRFDGDNLVLLGRARQVLKKGGQLLSLNEVESVARDFVSWGDVAALPIEDSFYGENYVLLFESRGEKRDATELHTYLSAKLSRWKLPFECVEVESLPRTASGKIAWAELRKSVDLGVRAENLWIRPRESR